MSLINRRRMLLMMGGRQEKFSRNISPSFGAEMLSDPGLEATYSAGLCASLAKNGSPTLSQSADVHGGTKAQAMTGVATNNFIAANGGGGTIGKFVQGSMFAKRNAGTQGQTNLELVAATGKDKPILSTEYAQYLAVERSASTPYILRVREYGAAVFDSIITDDWSIRELDTPSTFGIHRYTSVSGDVLIKARLNVYPLCPIGFWLNVDNPANPANGVACWVDGAVVRLEKLVNGTWTNNQLALTWNDGDELKVIKIGTAYQWCKNDVAIGVTATISDATVKDNKNHVQFSTNSNGVYQSFDVYGNGVPYTFLGDSLTFSTIGWAYQLSRQYGRGNNFIIPTNRGVSGAMIADGTMATQVTAASGDTPSVIICEFGTNDNNAGNMATLQSTLEANLVQLQSDHPASKIYYMNVLPKWTNNTGATPVDKSLIRAAISAACAAHGVTCWDTFTVPWIVASDTVDGVHPSGAGYQLVTNQVLARIA